MVKKLRKWVGATQEEFADDICSVQSLSRIETGKAGISYIMLKKFMEKAGVNSNVYPAFRDKLDCDIYRELQLCLHYIDIWMLEEASQVLREVDALEYGGNQLHYQQGLYCKALILLKSGLGDEKEVNDLLDRSLRITKPEYHIEWLQDYWLSHIEIRLLMTLAYSYLTMGQMGICDKIINTMESYLEELQISEREKAVLKEKNGVIHACSLMKKGCFAKAQVLLEKYHVHAVTNKVYSELSVIIYLKGICEIHMGAWEKGKNDILNCYYASVGMRGFFAERIVPYVQTKFPDFVIDKQQRTNDDIFLPSMDVMRISEDKKEQSYYLGNLIRDVRMEKGIRQSVLCKGICSKSALSKIENCVVIPEQEIMEALLQRLGIHTEVFEIYLSEQNFSFHAIKKALTAAVIVNNKKEADQLFDLLLKKVNEKSAIQRQYVLYIWGMLEQDSSRKQFLLREALYQTLPDFHIAHIQKFVLTHQEMIILIELTKSCKEDTIKTIFILYKLLEYFQVWTYETLEKARIQKEIVSTLSRLLLSEKRFREMTQISKIMDNLLVSGDYQTFAMIYENMYQSFYELEPCTTNENINLYSKAFQHILNIH